MYDGIPIRAPILPANIPIVKIRCGGLSKPSKPKAECQKKSSGPANISIETPVITNFIDKSNSRSLSPFLEETTYVEYDLQWRNIIVAPIMATVIPLYNIICGGEKKVSGLFKR
jgi:hypothetical protein